MKYLIAFFLLLPGIKALCQESDLPLTLKSAPAGPGPMVFYISGDGGWNNFDKKLAEEYETNRMPYIALNSLRYFWSRKTPDQIAKEMVPVLYKYLKVWNKKEMVVIGYSFGAEILPFIVTRLPADLKEKVKLIVLITPSSSSDFTIHLNDMLLMDGKYRYNVVAEISKISTTPILCFFGSGESSIFSKSYTQKNLKVILVKGGHVFSDAQPVMKGVLDALKIK